MKARILVVDDEPQLIRVSCGRFGGLRIRSERRRQLGADALEALRTKAHGFSSCSTSGLPEWTARRRCEGSHPQRRAVIVLSAATGSREKVLALDLGAMFMWKSLSAWTNFWPHPRRAAVGRGWRPSAYSSRKSLVVDPGREASPKPARP